MKKLILATLIFISTQSFGAIDPFRSFSYSVPDKIIETGTKNAANFKDTSGITCSIDYENTSYLIRCIAARELVFEYKKQHPKIHEFCQKFQGGFELVATCMIGWIEDNNWTPSSRLKSELNLTMRGCIANHGTNYNKVLECYKK